MKTLIIGLGNKARNGKDTLASELHALYPKESRIMSLADELKATARSLGMGEKHGPFLQQLGAACRTLRPTYWIERLEARIAEANVPLVLVPDVRYRNEAQWINQQGGILVRVSRIMEDGSAYVASDRPANHPSETELDGPFFDYYFNIRNGDMAAFKRAAASLSYLIDMRIGSRTALPTLEEINVQLAQARYETEWCLPTRVETLIPASPGPGRAYVGAVDSVLGGAAETDEAPAPFDCATGGADVVDECPVCKRPECSAPRERSVPTRHGMGGYFV